MSYNPFLGALKTLLTRRGGKHVPLWLGILAILLTLPGLWVGFAVDDHVFLSILKGSPGLEELGQPIWNTFSFAEGDPERNRIRMERGIMPWWAAEDWKVDLWRPLASLTHWFDLKVFGDRAWPMHLHSLLLYGLLGILATVLYTRWFNKPWVAGLAGLLFVVDGAHGIPAGWLSNRNALLAGIFGVLALLSHHEWRTAASKDRTGAARLPHGLLALVWLALALLSGETAVSLGGFFFAYALFLDPLVYRGDPLVRGGDPRGGGFRNGDQKTAPARHATRGKDIAQSILVLWPYLGVVLVWRFVYSGLGHGVRGSWMYVDPLADPGVMIRNGAEHLPVLMLGLLGAPDSTAWAMLPRDWQMANVIAGILFTLFVGWTIWPLLKRDAMARFLALGTVLAVIPSCATLPMDRNLMFPSIGSAALIALFVTGFFDRERWAQGRTVWRGAARTLVWAWLGLHLVLSPLWLLGSSYCIVALDRAFARANDSVPLQGQRFVVVNTPLDLLGASLPFVRSGRGLNVPKTWWWLAAGNRPVEVERIDEHTVALRPEGGFLQRPWSQIFRRPETHPMVTGQRIQLDGLEAHVTKTGDDGRPSEVQFHFDVPPGEGEVQWLTWSRGRYVPFIPPSVGETIRVPGLDSLHLLRLTFGLEHLPQDENGLAR